jgi:hypothetical protein
MVLLTLAALGALEKRYFEPGQGDEYRDTDQR